MVKKTVSGFSWGDDFYLAAYWKKMTVRQSGPRGEKRSEGPNLQICSEPRTREPYRMLPKVNQRVRRGTKREDSRRLPVFRQSPQPEGSHQLPGSRSPFGFNGCQWGPAILVEHPTAGGDDVLYGYYRHRRVGAEAERMHCPTSLALLIEPTGICLCTSAMRL